MIPPKIGNIINDGPRKYQLQLVKSLAAVHDHDPHGLNFLEIATMLWGHVTHLKKPLQQLNHFQRGRLHTNQWKKAMNKFKIAMFTFQGLNLFEVSGGDLKGGSTERETTKRA